MKARNWIGALALVIGTAFITTQVVSQEPGGAMDKIKGAAQEGMDKAAAAAQDEMMKKWMEVNAPGAHHKHLEKFVGTWKTRTKCWMAPGAPAEESSGQAEFKSIFDGRYIVQDYKGEMMGKPFAGMGLIGYDNMKKQYRSLWIDNWSTGMSPDTGTCDADGRTFDFSGEMDDPMSGQTKKYRMQWKFRGPSEFVLLMYDTGPDGKEFQNMEITYNKG